MATTIKGAFDKFRQNLEITEPQERTVSTRQKNVREVVEKDLAVLDSFLIGSYRRHTMIAPLKSADVDIFVVLDPKYYHEHGQTGLLDKVKAALLKTYTLTPKISRNGQAVTITFEDFVVDVVPAFNAASGGFYIPSTAGRWIQTDPREHVKLSRQNNTAHNEVLVPLEKMVKCWNREIGHSFHSFHLEVLAWKIFDRVTINDFSSGARFYFDKGRSLIKEKNLDPAGYSGDVGYYINSNERIEAAVSRFQTAYGRAVKAEQLAKSGNCEAAINEWRKIFGTTMFPAFG